VTILAFILTAPARSNSPFRLGLGLGSRCSCRSSSPCCTIEQSTLQTASSTEDSIAIRKSRTAAEIKHVLADEASRALKLTSAASFRHQWSVLSRDGNGKGWDDCGENLRPDEPMLAPLVHGAPFRARRAHTEGLDVPKGLGDPVLAVPSANSARCFAVSLYGPHASGTDSTTTSAPCSPASPMTPPACTRNLRTTSCVRKSWLWNTSLRRHERSLGPAPFVREHLDEPRQNFAAAVGPTQRRPPSL
jgi:hypothetical protein